MNDEVSEARALAMLETRGVRPNPTMATIVESEPQAVIELCREFDLMVRRRPDVGPGMLAQWVFRLAKDAERSGQTLRERFEQTAQRFAVGTSPETHTTQIEGDHPGEAHWARDTGTAPCSGHLVVIFAEWPDGVGVICDACGYAACYPPRAFVRGFAEAEPVARDLDWPSPPYASSLERQPQSFDPTGRVTRRRSAQ